MEKLYNRIDFHNDSVPALNESNLNAISKGLDDIDDRLIKVAKMVGNGSGGGSSDYNDLDNKPSINDVVLEGNKTAEELGIIATDVEWNQIQEDGKKIAEITINGEPTDVFAPEGSGSITRYGTTEEFEEIKDDPEIAEGTEYLITDDYVDPIDYSEEETCIGTYMGKKRYVKICHVTRTTATSANTWNAVASAPANVERVIHIEFLRVNDALGTIVSQYSRIYNGNIELYNTFTIGATAMTNAHVLIEYTKVGE